MRLSHACSCQKRLSLISLDRVFGSDTENQAPDELCFQTFAENSY